MVMYRGRPPGSISFTRHTHQQADLQNAPSVLVRVNSLHSLDINPTDYSILGIIQRRVHQTKVQDVNDLMQRLTDVWARVEESGRY